MSNPAQGAVGAETKFKIGDRVQIVSEPNDDNEPGQITGERAGWFEVTWTERDGLTYGEGLYWWQAHELRPLPAAPAALASPRADSDERTAGAKAVSARTLAGMLRSRIERASEHKSETVSLGQFFADQIHRYLTEAGHGPEHDARSGDVPADGGDPDCDRGRDWGLRARQVHLEALSKRAAGGKWFASTNGSDGLARLDNGTDGMFPVRGEWHEIEFVEALVNAYRNGDLATPAQPAGAVPDSLRALLDAVRPFYACVFNDNGDVSISTGNLTVHHWLALDRAFHAVNASHPAGQSAGSGETIAVQKRDLVKMVDAAFAVDPSVPTEAQGDNLFAAATKLASYLPLGLECTGCGSRESIEAIQARGFSSCCPERKMQPAPDSTRTGQAEDWRDDPSADVRWNAGLVYGHDQLCRVLGVDPDKVSWDAATETLDGDVQSVICNILRAWAGDDWQSLAARPADPEAQGAEREGFNAGYAMACANIVNLHGEDTIAENILAESGITLAEVKALDLTEYDMKPLRALFREIARKRKISKARPAPPASSGQGGR